MATFMSKAKTSNSILVVDDQPDLVETLSLTLECAGYEVLTASDGLDALTVLQSQPVALILSDIEMPRMNGYQFYQQVCKNPRWATIPFLFLSGRALDSDIRYGKQLGVDDYLIKPIRPNDLLAIIQGKLRRAHRLSHKERLSAALSAQPGSMLDTSHLELGRLKIALRQYRVWLDGQTIKLSVREFKLLACLAQRHGEVISLVELGQSVGGMATDHTKAGLIIRPLICSLRKKLGQVAGRWIEIVRGVGYRLAIPEE